MTKRDKDLLKKFYVYAAYGANNELLYIGKGKGSRWKHCASGISSSRDLNRYYFSNGEGDCIKVKILQRFNTDSTASSKELDLIKQYSPPFNLSGARVTNVKMMDEIKEHYNLVSKYLESSRTEKGSKMSSGWITKYKNFVSLIGYKNLLDGVDISKESVKMYGCPKALGFYEAVIGKRRVTKVITSLFLVEKLELGLYRVKIDKDILLTGRLNNEGEK